MNYTDIEIAADAYEELQGFLREIAEWDDFEADLASGDPWAC